MSSKIINWRNMFDQSEEDATQWLSKQTREDLIWMLQANDTNGIYTDKAHTAEFGQPATIEQLKESFWRTWFDEHCEVSEFTHNGVKFKCRPVDAKDFKDRIEDESWTGDTVEEVFRYRLWYYYRVKGEKEFHVHYIDEHVHLLSEKLIHCFIDLNLDGEN